MSASRLASQVFWYAGLATIARKLLTRRGRFVVSFHGVAAARRDSVDRELQPSFSAHELRTALRWIRRRFDFLTPDELLAGGRPGVLLTFDDGYANHHDTALPVLEELDAPAVFFVTTQHVTEPRDWLPAIRKLIARRWPTVEHVPNDLALDYYDGMSSTQLEKCARHPLIEIGSHTLSHPFLSRCDDASLERELVQSKATLESWTDREVRLFAYPTGDYDRRVAEATRSAGYRAAFAEDPFDAGLPQFEIPRIGLYDCTSPYLGAKLSGLHRPPLGPETIFDASVERH